MRLKDRIFSRSPDESEINEAKGRSQHDIKKDLNCWDLIWFGMGVVIGAGMFVVGLAKADIKNYAPFAPFTSHGIFKAFVVLFYAYIWFDAVSKIAEETKNPARDIPLGLIGSMVIYTTVYCTFFVVFQSTPAAEATKIEEKPITEIK